MCTIGGSKTVINSIGGAALDSAGTIYVLLDPTDSSQPVSISGVWRRVRRKHSSLPHDWGVLTNLFSCVGLRIDKRREYLCLEYYV
jgi:hypothetical protein